MNVERDLALLKYFAKPTGELSRKLPLSAIVSANNEVQKITSSCDSSAFGGVALSHGRSLKIKTPKTSKSTSTKIATLEIFPLCGVHIKFTQLGRLKWGYMQFKLRVGSSDYAIYNYGCRVATAVSLCKVKEALYESGMGSKLLVMGFSSQVYTLIFFRPVHRSQFPHLLSHQQMQEELPLPEIT